MSADIDIDLADRSTLLKIIKHIPAKKHKRDERHLSGVYIQPIPYNPIYKYANLDYIEADELPSALENSDVVFKDTFDDQLSDHSVLTVDSELNEYFDVDDIVDKVIDQIEITRK